MRLMKRAATQLSAVMKGLIFIGFSIQIVLGIFWMCCNFGRQQDFGEPGRAFYAGIVRLTGGNAPVVYLLQLALAAFAGRHFLRRLRDVGRCGKTPGIAFDVWEILVLLTFPFAMQCHLALQPHSFTGSLFLLLLSLLLRAFGGGCGDKPGGWKRALCSLGTAAACLGLIAALSGAFDADRPGGLSGRGLEAVIAHRVAWPTLWVDHEAWPDELRGIEEDIVWKANYSPGDMELLAAAMESRVDEETAKACYRRIAQVAWEFHAPMVIRQIGWDVLGYALTPIIFRIQMEGGAYNSCTGRNYEVMRGNEPVVTRCYVEYGCWWFACCLALTVLASIARLPFPGGHGRKRLFAAAAGCTLASGVMIAFLVMRGSGLMDYKETTAVNELWLAWALLLVRGNGSMGAAKRLPDGSGQERLAETERRM